MTPTPNGIFARALVAHLAANGVERFILCPGSRSGPLAHVLAEATSEEPPMRAPSIKLDVRIDERSAGFMALGLAMATGDPVAVVTTSGTAVGNLLPAVMEAHHGGHRLVFLTADRPFDIRGTGTNQTTDQRHIFGRFVQFSRDVYPPTAGRALVNEAEAIVAEAMAHAAGAVPPPNPASDSTGPVHLNLQFRHPLGRDYGPWPSAEEAVLTLPEEALVPPLPEVERGVVVAGNRAGPAAATIASTRGWPLFAEPTSDARRGGSFVPGYAEALDGDRAQDLVQEVELVLVVGRPTLYSAVARFVASAPRLWVARYGARWKEVPVNAEVVSRDIPFEWMSGTSQEPVPDSWLARWLEVGREPEVEQWGPRAVAQEVAGSLGSGHCLVVGSSGPVRALDAVLPALKVSECPAIRANRGLSGIDGTVSTAMGMALAGLGPVTALVGDLTFLHDVGGLLTGRLGVTPKVRFIVVNDGGGTIFAHLEHGAATDEVLERVFTVPPAVEFGPLCQAYGATHIPVRDRRELAEALTRPIGGIEVIEARIIPGPQIDPDLQEGMPESEGKSSDK